MTRHRNPRRKVPKRPSPDNFTLGLRIRCIYEALVELEALAITADEAVTSLPVQADPGPVVLVGRSNRRSGHCRARAGRGTGRPPRGDQVVIPRALHLVDVLCDQLAELGPGACSLSVAPCSTWQLIRPCTTSGIASRRWRPVCAPSRPRSRCAWPGSRVWAWTSCLPASGSRHAPAPTSSSRSKGNEIPWRFRIRNVIRSYQLKMASSTSSAITCKKCRASAGCEQHFKFRCITCKRVVAWADGADGCMPNSCSQCWSRAHCDGRKHVTRHGARCDVVRGV